MFILLNSFKVLKKKKPRAIFQLVLWEQHNLDEKKNYKLVSGKVYRANCPTEHSPALTHFSSTGKVRCFPYRQIFVQCTLTGFLLLITEWICFFWYSHLEDILRKGSQRDSSRLQKRATPFFVGWGTGYLHRASAYYTSLQQNPAGEGLLLLPVP